MRVLNVIEYRSGDWLNGASGPEWVEQPAALCEFGNGLRGLVFLPGGPDILSGIPHTERARFTRDTCVLRLPFDEDGTMKAMRLEWSEVPAHPDFLMHRAEYEVFTCTVSRRTRADDDLWCGDIFVDKAELADIVSLRGDERLPLDDMKRLVEDRLGSVLKEWHDAYNAQ